MDGGNRAMRDLSLSRDRLRDTFVRAVGAELDNAYAKHGDRPWGRHEFYGVLLEEVDELWDAIKGDEPQERVYAELVQVAAMCFRYFEQEGGDGYGGVAGLMRFLAGRSAR